MNTQAISRRARLGTALAALAIALGSVSAAAPAIAQPTSAKPAETLTLSKNTGTLGGWNWAVNKYSKNTKAAVDLAKYLTSPEEQKRAAIEVSFNPTIPALYKDKDILAKNPFIGELLSTFTNAVARPSRVTGSKYNQVSSEFWNAVHETLSGKSQAEESLAKLEKTLTRLSRNGKW